MGELIAIIANNNRQFFLKRGFLILNSVFLKKYVKIKIAHRNIELLVTWR